MNHLAAKSLSDTEVLRDTAPVIEIEDVSKLYHLNAGHPRKLRDIILKRPIPPEALHRAVDGISLTVQRGETVGLLGTNGAGKSTLLQLITGTLTPTGGKVTTRGRISALLELGAGFNPQWTGRKNAEFQCVLQGVPSSEIKATIAAIEEFADIGRYFDEPTRTYSSGMFLRVAFASSVLTEPDILIVDEALAVGDAKFQNKCFRRFEEMQERGCTVLLVTHSTDMVARFCSRGVVLQRGKVVFDGEVDQSIRTYLELLYGADQKAELSAPKTEVAKPAEPARERKSDGKLPPALADLLTHAHGIEQLHSRDFYNSQEKRIGSGKARISDAVLIDQNGITVAPHVRSGDRIRVGLRIEAFDDVERPFLGLIVKSQDNVPLHNATSHQKGLDLRPLRAGEIMIAVVEFDALLSSGYCFIDLGIGEMNGTEFEALDWRMAGVHFYVEGRDSFTGLVDLNSSFSERYRVDG